MKRLLITFFIIFSAWASIFAQKDDMRSSNAINAPSGVEDDSKYLQRLDGVNLRILDDNIWDYSKETLPKVWEELCVDCRDDARAPQFAGLVEKYSPDLLAFQEYSSHMHERIYPLLQKQGLTICTTGTEEIWNNTPIFYKEEALEMVENHYVRFTPSQWSNHDSKSFTSAVFVHKATGRKIALISTHLWWKSDKAQAGSTYARASQVYQIIAEAAVIKSRHSCPVIVVGDMNCEESTLPIQAFLQADFVPCYKLATIYADNHNGHHICAPNDGFSVQSRRKGPERATGAIDHCLLFNGENVEVKVFDCIMSAFTVPLTDHYPNLIDLAIVARVQT